MYPKLLKILGLSSRESARTFWGGNFETLLPEAVSTQIWRYGFFEEDVCLFMLRSLQPSMCFIDVGAHFGFFSLLASNLVGATGRVLAFEPAPETFSLLDRNTSKHSRWNNITTINSAAFSSNTTLTFNDYGLINSALDSAFGARTPAGAMRIANTISVAARMLDHVIDELGIPHVDMIKIDAESSEIHVLRGAEVTIERFKPRIVLEVGDFQLSGVVESLYLVDWLQKRGYRPHEYRDDDIRAHESRAKYPYGNLLFIHSG